MFQFLMILVFLFRYSLPVSTYLLTKEWWRKRGSNTTDSFGGQCCKVGLGWSPYKSCKGLLYDYIGPGAAKSFGDLSMALRKAVREVGDVVILGDSISRQLFESLVCFLGAEWKGWQKERELGTISVKHLREVFGKVPRLNTGEAGFANVSAGPGSSAPRLYFYTLNNQHVTLKDVRKLLTFHSFSTLGRVYVDWRAMNVGFPGTELSARLSDVVRLCEELNLTAACVLREPTPQHFVSWGEHEDGGPAVFTHGLHNASYANHQFRCHNSIVKQYDQRARFRADIVWQIRGNLSVLPLIDALLPRGDAHIDADCTHWAFDASLWHAVHAAILRDLQRGKR